MIDEGPAPDKPVARHPTEALSFFTNSDGVRFKYDAETDTAYYAIEKKSHPYAQLFGYTLLRHFASITKIERVGADVFSVRPHASADIVPIEQGHEPREITVSRFMCAAILRDFDHYTGAQGHEGGAANIRITDRGDKYLFDLGAVFGMFGKVHDIQLLLRGILDECSDAKTVELIEYRLVRFLDILKDMSDPSDFERGVGLIRHAVDSTGVPAQAIFKRKNHNDVESMHRKILIRTRQTLTFVRIYREEREAREGLFK